MCGCPGAKSHISQLQRDNAMLKSRVEVACKTHAVLQPLPVSRLTQAASPLAAVVATRAAC